MANQKHIYMVPFAAVSAMVVGMTVALGMLLRGLETKRDHHDLYVTGRTDEQYGG